MKQMELYTTPHTLKQDISDLQRMLNKEFVIDESQGKYGIIKEWVVDGKLHAIVVLNENQTATGNIDASR